MKKVFFTAFVLMAMVFVSQAQTHTVGESFGGGIVFNVTADGLHGLIAETINQGNCKQTDAAALIANAANHSEAGKTFTDWRLPNKEEMQKLWSKKTVVKGFTNGLYWCSGTINSERGAMGPLVTFSDDRRSGSEYNSINKPLQMPAFIRSIRTF